MTTPSKPTRAERLRAAGHRYYALACGAARRTGREGAHYHGGNMVIHAIREELDAMEKCGKAYALARRAESKPTP